MKKISSVEKVAAAALLLGIYFFRKKKRYSIPFDKEKACENIRPFDVLMNHVRRFEERYENSGDSLRFDKVAFPTSITYNRDAFIALINAPKSEKVRVYFGIKNDERSKKEQVVFCIFPVDKKNKVINAVLVEGCPPMHNQSTEISNHALANEARASSQAINSPAVAMKAVSSGQGLDDGQRPPYS